MLARCCRAAGSYFRVLSRRSDSFSSGGGHLYASSCRSHSNATARVEPSVLDHPEETVTGKSDVNLNKLFWAAPCSLALPADSPHRIEEPQYEGIKRFILRLMLFYSKQSKSIRAANVIYSRVVSQVDRPPIYNVFSLEKTFKTTFSLLALHMWLCLRRLKEDGNEGVELGQYVYEIYNHDVELRVSKAGVNLLLSKWMKDLEKIFYGNIVAYDAAMLPEAKQDALQNAIWRNTLMALSNSCVNYLSSNTSERFSALVTSWSLFFRNVFSDDGSLKVPTAAALYSVQAMARYTRLQSTSLSLTDKEAIAPGNFMFTPLGSPKS